jgi:uncharacterized protein
MYPLNPRLFLHWFGAAALALSGAHAAAAADDTPAKVSVGTCAKPEWPKEALRNEQTGKVTLAFKIGADGAVLESVVKESSGFPLLDEAARTGLIRCQFKPATVNGRAEASWPKVQYVWALEDKVDPAAARAFEATRERAAHGEVAAQRELGAMYTNGKGVARNFDQALLWLGKAADAGDAEAQYRLATAYHGGFGVPSDAGLALAWARKSAEQGYPDAQMLLGTLYLAGRGVPRDDAQAVDWFRKAVAQNHGPAFKLLAGVTREGLGGIVADPAEARRLLRQGAVLNDPYAQFLLGADLVTSGTPPEQADGVKWLLKAAPLGLPQLQSMVGLAYRDGIGIARDYGQARAWLGKAASQSWPQAQYALAVLTEQGMGGPRNETEALALYRKAAARGIPEAALRLADAAAQGELGNPVDPATAEEWRKKAAGMGRRVH